MGGAEYDLCVVFTMKKEALKIRRQSMKQLSNSPDNCVLVDKQSSIDECLTKYEGAENEDTLKELISEKSYDVIQIFKKKSFVIESFVHNHHGESLLIYIYNFHVFNSFTIELRM
jgi:hypothetical protein